MTGLLLFLLVVVGFIWMFKRSVAAGHGKLLFWLAWTIGGIFAVLGLPPELRSLAQVLVWVWMIGMIGLPLWWLGRRIIRSRNGPQATK